MLRLTREERGVPLDRVPDLANLAAGTVVFGQMLRDEPFSIGLALGGIGIWAALMALTFVLTRDEQ